MIKRISTKKNLTPDVPVIINIGSTRLLPTVCTLLNTIERNAVITLAEYIAHLNHKDKETTFTKVAKYFGVTSIDLLRREDYEKAISYLIWLWDEDYGGKARKERKP